jgi:chaperone required for assembly of F1-ATPase
MKRFYEIVSVKKVEDGAGAGYTIMLDGKPVKTPSKNLMVVPNLPLAELVAAEWVEQETHILPDTMPLTQLVNTRIEKIGQERAALEAQILKYIDTDLLCYRAQTPDELVARQSVLWQKPLDWYAEYAGHCFAVTDGLKALKQPAAIHQHIAADIAGLDIDRFTVLQMLVPLFGSVVLALAFLHGAQSADDVMACCFLEEDYKFDLYNEQLHGGDPLTEKKRTAMRRDVEAAQDYLDTL